MKIQDGRGNGRYALVNSEFRVGVDAVMSSKLGYISRTSANSYIIKTGILTLTSTAEHSLLYIYNNGTSDFSFSRIWLGYNGGSTTWNKTALFKFIGGLNAPSANSSDSAAGNLNTGSANTATLDVKVWNGTGTGMTHTVAGGEAGSSIVGKGTLTFDFPGFILAPGGAVAFSVIAEEVGIVTVSATGYFDTTES